MVNSGKRCFLYIKKVKIIIFCFLFLFCNRTNNSLICFRCGPNAILATAREGYSWRNFRPNDWLDANHRKYRYYYYYYFALYNVLLLCTNVLLNE